MIWSGQHDHAWRRVCRPEWHGTCERTRYYWWGENHVILNMGELMALGCNDQVHILYARSSRTDFLFRFVISHTCYRNIQLINIYYYSSLYIKHFPRNYVTYICFMLSKETMILHVAQTVLLKSLTSYAVRSTTLSLQGVMSSPRFRVLRRHVRTIVTSPWYHVLRSLGECTPKKQIGWVDGLLNTFSFIRSHYARADGPVPVWWSPQRAALGNDNCSGRYIRDMKWYR